MTFVYVNLELFYIYINIFMVKFVHWRVWKLKFSKLVLSVGKYVVFL